MNISVALATYNEEENIGRCLESVYGSVDEIVIVDGSSTDKTVNIAKKFKAKVIISDNPSIFHINKQKAIDACSSEWILQLDADEVVPDDLRREILNAINHQPQTTNNQLINGYWIPRKNYFLGKFLQKGGQYPDYTLRLYRKGKGHLPCKSVHEQAEVQGRVEYLKCPLQHFPYPDFSHYLEHFHLYTAILADELKKEKLQLGFKSLFLFIVWKPLYWFLLTFIRHKGFYDGYHGFIFSLFSSLRFPVAFVKYFMHIKRTD